MSEQVVSISSDKQVRAAEVLTEMFSKMGLQSELEFKDAEDGSLSVAVKLNAELPGAVVGKRSHVVESLQFLLNKIVNRTPDNRRWISVGWGEHPAPRPPKPVRSAPGGGGAAVPPAPSVPKAPPTPPSRPVSAPTEQEEGALEAAPDPALEEAALELAQKCASRGRLLALVGMKAEDRALVLKAVRGVEGLKVRAEGEGRNRRVAFFPDRPTPMPKHALAIWEEELAEEEGE